MKYPKVFFSLSISTFFVAIGIAMAIPFLPLYARTLGASETTIGVVVGSFYVMRMFMELPSGLISDRMGRRLPMVLGLLSGFLGALICGFAVEPMFLILGRALWGLGTGFFYGSAWGFLFDIFASEGRGTAMSIFQSIEFIGFTVGSPLGGFTATVLGEKSSFLLIGIIMLIALVLIITPRELRRSKAETTTESHREFSLHLLKNWGFLIVCFAGFMKMFMRQGVVSTIFPIYLKNVGLDLPLIGIIIGVRSIGILISTALTGLIVNRVSLKSILLFGLGTSSITVFLFSMINTYEIFLLLGLINGMASGIEMIALTLFLSEMVPKEIRGAGIGIYRTFFDAGAVFGPISLTALLSVVGEPYIRTCFYMGSAVSITTLVMVLAGI